MTSGPLHDRRCIVPETTLFEDLGGETVLLNLATGVYYRLDEVGGRIWAGLRTHGAPERVVEAIVTEYDVDPERARLDLRGLLDDLVASGLIQWTGDDDRPA